MPKEAKFVTPQWIYSPWGSGWSVSAPAANKRFLIAFPTFLGVVSAITYYVETNCKTVLRQRDPNLVVTAWEAKQKESAPHH